MFLYEDHNALLLHRRLGLAGSATSATELAGATELPTRQSRESLLKSWLPESLSHDIPVILDTLQVLREALILSHSHVDHCFSSLTETPKNKLLRLLLHRYLDSPLSHDITLALWTKIEEIKTRRNFVFTNSETEVIGIPAVHSSLLFTELLNALRLCPTFTSVGTLTAASPNPFWHAPIERSLLAFSKHLSRTYETGERCHVHFAGSPASLLLLKAILSKFSVPFSSLFPESAVSTDSPLVARLRRETRIPLKRRLELCDKWIHGITGGATLLTAEETVLLEAPTQTPSETSRGVLMTPLTPLAPSQNIHQFAFCDDSIFTRIESAELYLSPQEREQLFLAGFPVPRTHEQVQQKMDALAALGNSAHVYWSAEKEKCRYPTETLSEDNEPTSKSPISYHAAVQVKAFSATALEAFDQCPAKYFLTNRLRLRAKHASEADSGLFFGQAVHLALERFLKGQNNTALETLFTQALAEVAPNLTPDSTLYFILHFQFKKVAARFMALETKLKEMFPESRPWKLEADFFTELEGTPITGKLDRLEQLRDGSLLILDYKTGTVDFSPDHMTNGKNFQALLYLIGTEAISNQQPLAGILFYDLKKAELRRGLLRETLCGETVKKAITRGHAVTDDRWESLLTAGKTKIAETIRSVRTGDFSPQPDANTCRFCEGANICRQAEGYT